MKPKIIITIRKPRASLPLPRESTSFNAVELTTVEPRKAKNLRVVDRAVLSWVSVVRLGRMEAMGMFTTV